MKATEGFIKQAEAVVQESGGLVVSAENVERFNARMSELVQREAACKAALARVNKLGAAIEKMEYDCDGEVYDELWKIADILSA